MNRGGLSKLTLKNITVTVSVIFILNLVIHWNFNPDHVSPQQVDEAMKNSTIAKLAPPEPSKVAKEAKETKEVKVASKELPLPKEELPKEVVKVAAPATQSVSTNFVRSSDSRLFAYIFLDRKASLKVDLFYDKDFDGVAAFVKAVMDCRLSTTDNHLPLTIQSNVSFDVTGKDSVAFDSTRYKGLMSSSSGQGAYRIDIAEAAIDSVPADKSYIGGIVEYPQRSPSSSDEVVRCQDVAFTSVLASDEKENSDFQKLLEILRPK